MDFPQYIGSKKESMPKRLHEVNMHAQYFQEPIPIDKEIPSENRIPNREIITWKISLKDTSRNEISNDTRKKKDVKLPKERMVPNKQALYKVS